MKQRFKPDQRVLYLLGAFNRMTNDCIRIGLTEGNTSLKSLSLNCYPKLKTYEVPSAYKLCAISKAAGILRNYRKLSKRRHVKEPYCVKLSLTTCYGLRIHSGRLRLPGGVEIPVNRYVQRFLSQPRIEVRSATLTTESLSISVRRRIEPVN